MDESSQLVPLIDNDFNYWAFRRRQETPVGDGTNWPVEFDRRIFRQYRCHSGSLCDDTLRRHKPG